MKEFKRIDPTTEERVGGQFKRATVVKTFESDDGHVHEFTTWGREDARSGAIIALTTDNRVITMYQFRPGPEAWLYELPGGGINTGEEVETGVVRELKEETGYEPGTIKFLGELSTRDAYMNGRWYYYLATDCVPAPDGQRLDQEEVDQGAEVAFIGINELIENAKTSRMSDPVAVLMAYDELQARLQR